MHRYHADTDLQRMFILNIRMGEQFGFKHGMVLLGFSDRNVSRVLQNGMENHEKKSSWMQRVCVLKHFVRLEENEQDWF